MKTIEREKARSLRKKGMSMNQIVEQTGYSKTSVSLWTRDIVLSDRQRRAVSKRGRSVESIERRRTSRMNNQNAKRQILKNLAKKDFKNLSKRDLKLVGAVLYWGEGGKTSSVVRISNSDPQIIKVIMRFFREVCNVPESKFRAGIHTFEYANIAETQKHWSLISGIPSTQFYKPYIKQSIAGKGKRKTLPYGTLDIYVCDSKLFLKIMGWIERIAEIIIK